MKGIAEALIENGMSEEAARARAAMFVRVGEALRRQRIEPTHWYHVPGRIEVLGKHTDYAGGRSLLTAVERGFAVASAPAVNQLVRFIDVGRGDEVTLVLDQAAPPVALPHWAIYPAAVVKRLLRDFEGPFCGATVAFISDLPPSSGLSSSSALLIAAFEALRFANRLDARDDFERALPGVLDLAAYLGSVESGRPFRRFGGAAGVGTAGGSQDHTAILASEAGRLCQFGYAPARHLGSVALPPDLTFVIGVSGVIAQKSAGAREAYNRAAALSAALLEAWHTRTGRSDATLYEAVTSSATAVPELKEALRSGSSSIAAADLEARLDQFVDETLVFIPSAFASLGAEDLPAFGRIVDRSQAGAERGLGNQVPETIELARLARSLGAHAASAFGAGFGGSVWALVSRFDADRFAREWESAYRSQFNHPASSFFLTHAGPPLLRFFGVDAGSK